MNVTDRKLMAFCNELKTLVLDDYKNTYFRYHTLLLIQKYFDINILSFIVIGQDIDLEEKDRQPLKDNVTLGISKEALDDYYHYYYKTDPLYHKISNDNLVLSSSRYYQKADLLEFENYKVFLKKYGENYQVSIGLRDKDRVIGIISFLRPTSKGDFTDKEKKGIQKICDCITYELLKSLKFESLYLENHALKESVKDFPVAQLILDHHYNVMYYNHEAVGYIDALVGSKPEGFKDFFIREFVNTNIISDENVDCVVDIQGFTIMLSKKYHAYTHDSFKMFPYYNVYLFKKISSKENTFRLNKYYKLLTQREKEIALLIRKGLSNDEIADQLSISPLTVKTHVQRIFNKCEVSNRIQLIYLLFGQ